MSFGDKNLDRAYDRWATQTPEEYYGEDEDSDEPKDIDDEDIPHEEKDDGEE